MLMYIFILHLYLIVSMLKSMIYIFVLVIHLYCMYYDPPIIYILYLFQLIPLFQCFANYTIFIMLAYKPVFIMLTTLCTIDNVSIIFMLWHNICC